MKGAWAPRGVAWATGIGYDGKKFRVSNEARAADDCFSRMLMPTSRGGGVNAQALAGVSVAVLFLAQVLSAWHLELMFDEAYYRLWARHLDWGYYDHPPLIALWIRISTSLFGGSELGVRVLGIIATAGGAAAVYSMARDLFGDRTQAAFATLVWTACPLVGVGGMLVTPDTPLLFGWTIAIWALCRLYRTQDWRLWPLIGVGAGLALQAKYTALFLGPGILLAMTIVPSLRRWWRHPAPYVGGAMALAIFLPNIVWNARHGWQTFAKQFGRIGDTEWTLRFLFEFFGSQIGLLNPLTFVLVVAGLIFAARPMKDRSDESRRLLLALMTPLLVYFTFHSLHDRVQGNWLAPLYPLFALTAANAAFAQPPLSGTARRILSFAKRWCAPLGWAMTAAVYAQANLGLLPVPPKSDPTALLAGWRDVARDLDALALRENAGYVATQGYALTALLKVYGNGAIPVLQYNERNRWAYDATEPSPDPSRTGLSIVEERRSGDDGLRSRYARAGEIAHLERRRNGRVLERYVVYRLADPKRPILD